MIMLVLEEQTDRMQDSIRNKSSVWLDYIEVRNRLNKFEMFVSSLIHEKNIENCLFHNKKCCSK